MTEATTFKTSQGDLQIAKLANPSDPTDVVFFGIDSRGTIQVEADTLPRLIAKIERIAR